MQALDTGLRCRPWTLALDTLPQRGEPVHHQSAWRLHLSLCTCQGAGDTPSSLIKRGRSVGCCVPEARVQRAGHLWGVRVGAARSLGGCGAQPPTACTHSAAERFFRCPFFSAEFLVLCLEEDKSPGRRRGCEVGLSSAPGLLVSPPLSPGSRERRAWGGSWPFASPLASKETPWTEPGCPL